ncbi:MAG: PA domain-containing protein, partial [Anaerolineae bacterium]
SYSSPASSELALSVANTTPPQEFALAVVADWEADGEPSTSSEMAIEGASSGENAWLPPLALQGEIVSELAWYGMACNDGLGRTPEPAQDLTGKIALIERGTCAFYDKITNAETFGAIAVVVFSDARPRTIMGCGAPSDCANGPGIPGVMVERSSGLKLLDLIYDQEIPVTVSLDAHREVELTDTVSPDSSRGPSRHLSAIKPQISAPGQMIMAARAGTGNNGEKFSGTSMAGPMVTGVAALLWQRNYDEDLGLRPLDISALAMNYARPVIHITPEETGGSLAPVARQGAGLVDARASASAMTVVRSQRGIAGLSFGNIHTTSDVEPYQATKTLTIRNLSDAAKTYRPDYRFAFPESDAGQGVSLSFEPEIITVDPRWTGELEVTLTADPAEMRKVWGLRGFDPVREEAPFTLQEIDGYVSVVEVDGNGDEVPGGDKVNVPFHSLPRDHSCVTTGEDNAEFTLGGPGDKVVQQLSNTCNVDAPVEVFHLGGTDPVDEDVPGALDIIAAGVRTFQDERGNTILDFAIHTRGTRRIAQDADARVYFDLNQDGVWDRMAFSRDGVLALGTSDTEAYGRWFVQHLRPTGTGLGLSGNSLSNGGYWQPFDIDESVTRLLVSADDPIMGLGLDMESGNAEFDYAVRMVDRVGDFETDGAEPRYDDAPDGWTDDGGPTFKFVQSAVGCLQFSTADGAVSPGELAEFTVPAGSEVSLEARGCVAVDGPKETGLLLNFPSNVPGPDAAQVRVGRVERNVPTAVLPYLARNHRLVGSSGLTP